jgi:4-diphosphocytidyl-2C-methyl-D-erythritol kinase
MTGSGSAVFGIFETAAQVKAAADLFPPGTAFPSRFVDRRQYRKMWLKALGTAAGASCFADPG